MKITITGRPGSGKSTVSKMLAEEMNIERYSIGDMIRELAKEKNMTIEEINSYFTEDPRRDKEVDNKQIVFGKERNDFIVDSRLGFYFIPDSIKIMLDADVDTRAKRIAMDKREEERGDVNKIKKEILKREAEERERFIKVYGIDIYDMKNFDIVLDTSTLKPKEIVETLKNQLESL